MHHHLCSREFMNGGGKGIPIAATFFPPQFSLTFFTLTFLEGLIMSNASHYPTILSIEDVWETFSYSHTYPALWSLDQSKPIPSPLFASALSCFLLTQSANCPSSFPQYQVLPLILFFWIWTRSSSSLILEKNKSKQKKQKGMQQREREWKGKKEKRNLRLCLSHPILLSLSSKFPDIKKFCSHFLFL